MLERVQELTNEINTAKKQKEVILRFIEQTEDIPPIVLETLKQGSFPLILQLLCNLIKPCFVFYSNIYWVAVIFLATPFSSIQ